METTTFIRPADEHGRAISAARRFGASILAGQISGLVMAMVMFFVFAIVLGKNFFYPAQIIAAFLLGDGALTELTLGNFILGVVLHQLGPALFWSIAFGLFAVGAKRSLSMGNALLLGFFIGGAAEIVDVYLLMPPLQTTFNQHNIWMEQVPRFWDWAAHLVYGLALGYCYVLIRDGFARRTAEAAV